MTLFYFDLRGYITKKFNKNGVLQVDNIKIDSFSSPKEYFSHRRAKKLGENDYGRCISVIKKTNCTKLIETLIHWMYKELS